MYLSFCLPRPLPTVQSLSAMPWWAPLGGLAGADAVFAGLTLIDKPGADAANGLGEGAAHRRGCAQERRNYPCVEILRSSAFHLGAHMR